MSQPMQGKSWMRKPAELFAEREELLLDRHEEKQVYEGEYAKLRRENASLRDQLQRALRELKAYQVQYPSVHMGHLSDYHDLPPWATAPEVMTPLLEAYDAKIGELQALVTQQATQLESFQEKVEKILAENTSLWEERAQREHNDDGQLMNPLNAELVHELNERVEILLAENAILLERKELVSNELEQCQTELEQRTSEVTELTDRVSSLTKDLQLARGGSGRAEKDREEAAAAVLRLSDALGKVSSELEEAKELATTWQHRAAANESTVQDLRKQVKQLALKSEEEGAVTMRRVKAAEDRVRELHGQLQAKIQECDASQELVRKLRREYQSTRQDAEGMLQVMGGLERQLAEYSNREMEVEKLARESKEKIEESLVLRDQSLARQQQYKQEVERLLEERKNSEAVRLREVEAAAEAARNMCGAQIRAIEGELADATSALAKAKVESERTHRELRSLQEQLDKSNRAYEDDKRTSENDMKAMEDRLHVMAAQKEEAIARKREVQDMNAELRLMIDRMRAHEEATHGQLEEKERVRDREIEALRRTTREAQRELSDTIKLSNKRLKELTELRNTMDAQILAAQKRYEDETNAYRRRANEAETCMREMETQLAAEERRSRALLEQVKEKASVSVAQMDTKLAEAREIHRRLTDRNRSLELALRDATEEKQESENTLHDVRNKMARLQDDLSEAQSEIAELTTQLTASFEAREFAAKMSTRAYLTGDNVDVLAALRESKIAATSDMERYRSMKPWHSTDELYNY